MKYIIIVSLILMIIILIIFLLLLREENSIIRDSNLTFERSITNTRVPQNIIDTLELLNVRYYSFDNKLHQGQVLIHKELSDDIKKKLNFQYTK